MIYHFLLLMATVAPVLLLPMATQPPFIVKPCCFAQRWRARFNTHIFVQFGLERYQKNNYRLNFKNSEVFVDYEKGDYAYNAFWTKTPDLYIYHKGSAVMAIRNNRCRQLKPSLINLLSPAAFTPLSTRCMRQYQYVYLWEYYGSEKWIVPEETKKDIMFQEQLVQRWPIDKTKCALKEQIIVDDLVFMIKFKNRKTTAFLDAMRTRTITLKNQQPLYHTPITLRKIRAASRKCMPFITAYVHN